MHKEEFMETENITHSVIFGDWGRFWPEFGLWYSIVKISPLEQRIAKKRRIANIFELCANRSIEKKIKIL